jgi:hypothetical protein
MASIEVTSQVPYNAVPALNTKVLVLTYTKLNQNDNINVATYGNIGKVVFAKAQNDAAGADDPVTFSGYTLTLTSADIGAGRVLVVGRS